MLTGHNCGALPENKKTRTAQIDHPHNARVPMPATSTSATTINQPAPQSLATPQQPTTSTARVTTGGRGNPRKHRIDGKLKRALDAMVWEGLDFTDAAKAHDYHVATMRKMLERLHVRNYIKEQRDVFRTSLSAKNFHRLGEIRDQDDNQMAALGAIKVLEQIEAQPASTANERPGLVIVVVGAPQVTTSYPITEAKPLIEHDAGPRQPSDRDESDAE